MISTSAVKVGSDASGARRGSQVLRRLRAQPPAIWYRGELVKDVTAHPALRGGVATLAKLYDLQWQQPEISLYDSPTSGKKVARSFMMPRTHAELHSITQAMRVWEERSYARFLRESIHSSAFRSRLLRFG